MSDDEDRLSFPSDRSGRTAGAGPARRVPLDPGPQLRAAVAERAEKLDVTPEVFLLAAYALTLARWTGARRLPVRVNGDRVLGVAIADDASIDDYIRQRVDESTADGEVQVGFGTTDGVEVAVVFDWQAPTWAGYAWCQDQVWTDGELVAFTADLRAAAEQMALESGTLEDVRCISPSRRARLRTVNHTDREFPPSSLDELFRRTAGRAPDAVAVRHDATELTYAQLATAAAQQAQRLRASGVQPGDTVLIGLDRSAAEVVAVLGTVWAGAAYVGVDLTQPAAHTAQIVARSRPAAILASPDAQLPAGVSPVDTWTPTWTHRGVASPPADPGRLAYVAFTSGSTGIPKGVCIPHRAVIRLAGGAADYVPLGAGERVLRLSPLAFDASTLELWGTLLSGGTLEVYGEVLPSPTELGEFLVERGVTVAWFTAGLYRLLVEFAPDSLGGLRQVLTGGDVVPHEHVARMLDRFPGLTVTNGYGPTENTTFTTTHSVGRPEDIDGPLPIGRPLAGTRVYVLDERGRELPPGAVGELYTSGEGLATGYLGDEAETARRFGYFSPDVPERLYRTGDLVRLDAAGQLRFLGRGDDQVKIRGYRVELGAIGKALTALTGVRDALVFAVGADSASKRVVAAVVPDPAFGPIDPAGLRAALAERLPSYLIPTLWTVVDRLPVTCNGKVDRTALLATATPASSRAAPDRSD